MRTRFQEGWIDGDGSWVETGGGPDEVAELGGEEREEVELAFRCLGMAEGQETPEFAGEVWHRGAVR